MAELSYKQDTLSSFSRALQEQQPEITPLKLEFVKKKKSDPPPKPSVPADSSPLDDAGPGVMPSPANRGARPL